MDYPESIQEAINELAYMDAEAIVANRRVDGAREHLRQTIINWNLDHGATADGEPLPEVEEQR